MTTPAARNARADAQAQLGEGLEARVLEPSPPANNDPDWFADDPTNPAGATGQVVSPTSDGDVTWNRYVADHPEAAEFARGHWLGAHKRLIELNEDFAATRKALHQVAFFAVAPKRHAETGKLGLRWTSGGFGTPFHATDKGDEQVRVEGNLLVVQAGDTIRSHVLSTVAEAAAFLDIPYQEKWFADFHDPLEPDDPAVPLEIDAVAAEQLGDWFGFATSVLEELRRTPGAQSVGRVQLWPEHFDPSVELGDADAGQRASFGASPGDDAHPGPYLYVAAWGDVDRANPYWNDTSFNGASLSHEELLEAEDQYTTALEFLRRGHAQLTDA